MDECGCVCVQGGGGVEFICSGSGAASTKSFCESGRAGWEIFNILNAFSK